MEDNKNLLPNDCRSDEETITLIKQGETGLFADIFRKYFDKLKPIMLSKHGNSLSGEDAEDLISDALSKAFKNLDKYDSARAKFSTWMGTILDNTLTDWFRRSKRSLQRTYTSDGMDDDEATDPMDRYPSSGPSCLDILMAQQIKESITEAVLNVKSKHLRGLFVLKFVMMVEDKCIADILGTTESSVRSNVSRLLKEVEARFRVAYPDLGETGYENLARVIHDGTLSIKKEDLSKVAELKTRNLIKHIAFTGMTLKAAAKKLGIPLKKASVMILEGVHSVISRRLRSGSKVSEARLLQGFEDLVSAAFATKLKPDLGAILRESVDRRNTTFNVAAEKVGLNIHEFAGLLNGIVPEKQRDNNWFIEKLSKFINRKKDETRSLLLMTVPPKLAYKTMRSVHKESLASLLERELTEYIDRKYTKH